MGLSVHKAYVAGSICNRRWLNSRVVCGRAVLIDFLRLVDPSGMLRARVVVVTGIGHR